MDALKTFLGALLFAAGLVPACSRDSDTDFVPAAAPSASASAAAPLHRRARTLLAREHQRNSEKIVETDLSNREPAVRRQAARALARIADARAASLLARSLADEDAEVVAWSAYGLGYACRGRETATVRALVARAASWTTTHPAGRDAPGAVRTSSPLDVQLAIADALARCGNREAEITLRAWLDGPLEQSEHAALALGQLASHKSRLDDASIVALLNAASRPKDPLNHALFAFTRLQALGESVQARLLKVAQVSLKQPGLRRQYAVRALGRAGEPATEILEAVLLNKDYSAAERADAARELSRLGAAGQAALSRALTQLAPDVADDQMLVSPAWGPLLTALEAIAKPSRENREVLTRFASLPIEAKACSAVKLRLVKLRCHAAQLLAEAASLSKPLLSCDPDPKGRSGAMALLQVLDRGRLTGARYRRWRQLADSSDDRVVRQAALRLMPAHPEIPRPHEILATALRAKAGGTVATAAQVLAAYPDRASAEHHAAKRARGETRRSGAGEITAKPPQQSVVKALTAALKVKRPPDALQVRAALIDAAGALQVLSLKPSINQACKSENPTLREHAQRALRLLGERTRRCDRFTPSDRLPAELRGPLPPSARMRLHTDVGVLEIALDPKLAPVAVARVESLARAGFYNGTIVHRVVPGFVVQFGDPGGDGFGGSGRDPLRCETSPVLFPALAVGLALAGRDTGSSQLFVTLGDYPQLVGEYPLLGSASAGWHKLTPGDVIRKVELLK